MKKRSGFVSNSSSTSFIVTNKDDLREVKVRRSGVVAFRATELLRRIESFEKARNRFLDALSGGNEYASGVDFIAGDVRWCSETNSYRDELTKLVEKYGVDCWILSPVDRDWAYEENFECLCKGGTFESDL